MMNFSAIAPHGVAEQTKWAIRSGKRRWRRTRRRRLVWQPGSLWHVVRRYQQAQQQQRQQWLGSGAGGVGPTPAGDGACVNQRNGTLVLARGAELLATGCLLVVRKLGPISWARLRIISSSSSCCGSAVSFCVLAGGTISVPVCLPVSLSVSMSDCHWIYCNH